MAILAWEGVIADKELLIETVERWRDSAGLAFVDAYLACLATRERISVYSNNVTDLVRQGVEVGGGALCPELRRLPRREGAGRDWTRAGARWQRPRLAPSRSAAL